MLFDKEIILLQKEKEYTREEALEELAQEFNLNGLVTEKFLDGIINREKEFPTGLYVNNVGIAIPHTDSDKVSTSQIGFMSLKNPVDFRSMDGTEGSVPVQLIFMLGLKEAHEQLEILQKLIGLIQKQSVVEKLLNCSSKEEYLKIITNEELI